MTTIYEVAGGALRSTDELFEVLTFSAGEPHVNVLGAIGRRHFVLDVRGGGFVALGAALVAGDALRRSGAASVQLFIPYLPGARQDRGVPLTCKVYADLINAAAFDRVICLDPHSPVMPAMLDRLVVIGAAAVVDPRMVDTAEAVVICPDAGAVDRAHAVADRFGLSVVHARKHRDPRTGVVQHLECDPVPAGAVGVVVDDICDGGATFLHLADATGLPADRLRLWTTHGIYARGLDELRSRYSLIGSTDSVPTTATPDIHRPVRALLEQFLAAQPL